MIEYQHDLMRALNFTEADLEANRRGELGQHQRASLTATRSYLESAAFVLFIVGVLVVVMAILNLLWECITFNLLIVVGIFEVIVLYRLGNTGDDLKSGKVDMVEGITTVEHFSVLKGYESYWMEFGGLTFSASKKLYDVFIAGKYRAYYRLPSRRLISIEPLDGVLSRQPEEDDAD